jgi:hypothetical protein
MPEQPMKRRTNHFVNCQKRRQQEFKGGLPDKAMKLYINAWFPEWLGGEKPNSDRYVYVDRIEQ